MYKITYYYTIGNTEVSKIEYTDSYTLAKERVQHLGTLNIISVDVHETTLEREIECLQEKRSTKEIINIIHSRYI